MADRGLKDHEIASLVNAIRDAVAPICPAQSLRVLVREAVTKHLESIGRRIDALTETPNPDSNLTASPGLVPRLRGEWATLTMDADADLWRLRREAADEIERLRVIADVDRLRQSLVVKLTLLIGATRTPRISKREIEAALERAIKEIEEWK